MYDAILQSSARPFRATPDARFYFAHESIDSALHTVVRAIRRAEGPAMVLGAAGLGKSLLGELASNELRTQFDVIKLHAARLCSRKALLQNILFELQLPYRDLSEGELRLSILDRLEPNSKHAPDGVVIVVDEAHTLPSKLLEELRLITNFTRNGAPRARLLLIGGMQLEDTFAGPQMESFNQRLAARCYLTPMNRTQTAGYVEHQIAAAGYDTKEFITDEAIQAVCVASEGVPRLANQIMDHALVIANAAKQSPISAQLIQEAWADLQQLPSPWSSAADQQLESANSVEFGSLDDEDPEFSSFDIAPSTALKAAIEEQEQPPQAAAAISPEESTTAIDLSDYPSEAEAKEPPVDQIAARGVVDENSRPLIGSIFENVWELDTGDIESVENDDVEVVIQTEKATQLYADMQNLRLSDPDSNKVDSSNDSPVLVEFGGERSGTPASQVGDLDSNTPADTLDSAASDTTTPNFFAAFTMPESGEADTEERIAEAGNVAPQELDEQVEEELGFAPTLRLAGNDESPEISATSGQVAGELERETYKSVETEFATYGNELSGVASDSPEAVENTEKLKALEEEQLQYDSMGVWENDPPLTQELVIVDTSNMEYEVIDTATAPASEVAPVAEAVVEEAPAAAKVEASEPTEIVSYDEVQPSLSPSDLFGEDFELEESVASTNVVEMLPISQETLNSGLSFASSDETQPEEPKRLQEDLVAEDLRRIQEFADSMNAAPSSGTVDDVLDTLQPEDSMNLFSETRGWSVDVAAVEGDAEAAIQDEIEDAVSQMNFSAFTVEPFVDEQIAPEVVQAEGTQEPIAHEDILAMSENSTEDSNIFASAQVYDDDRDLLIIEEDLPATSRTADPQGPTSRTTPYSQLFAKLRT